MPVRRVIFKGNCFFTVTFSAIHLSGSVSLLFSSDRLFLLSPTADGLFNNADSHARGNSYIGRRLVPPKLEKKL